MEERLRKRLEEKGHTDPDKALESLGVKVEQKGHPRFSNEGFVWYGSMITDPTKDETGRFTVDPRVYYAGHYEQWLTWKARRKEPQNVTQEGWGDDWTPVQRSDAQNLDKKMKTLQDDIDRFLRTHQGLVDPQHLERVSMNIQDAFVLHKPYG